MLDASVSLAIFCDANLDKRARLSRLIALLRDLQRWDDGGRNADIGGIDCSQ